MARVKGFSDLKSVVREHHVYQSLWTSNIGENLSTAPDKMEEELSTMSLPFAYTKTKSVAYWLGTYRLKFQACLIIS